MTRNNLFYPTNWLSDSLTIQQVPHKGTCCIVKLILIHWDLETPT
jgi:hypothetical protein